MLRVGTDGVARPVHRGGGGSTVADVNARMPTALVLPTQYRAGPHVCRSLRAAGYRVIGAQPGRATSGGRSAACPQPLRHPPIEDGAAMTAWLRDVCTREAVDVVVPTTEDMVRFLAGTAPVVDAVIAGPNAAQYDRLCDKANLALAAREAGVPHPVTAVVGADGVAADSLPEAPCVVKPGESGETGRPFAARLARTDAERDDAIAQLTAADLDAVVQQYVDGPRLFAHAVRGSDAFHILTFRSDDDWPRREGPASFFSSVPTPPGLAETTERLLAETGYLGTVSLSFLVHDGRPLLHDVNLRVGATVVASMRAGFDVPALAVAAVRGLALPERLPPTRPVTYVRLDGEASALRAALRGRGDDRAGSLARRLLNGLARRGWVLDPSPLDVVWLADLMVVGSVVLARRLLRGGDREAPAAAPARAGAHGDAEQPPQSGRRSP